MGDQAGKGELPSTPEDREHLRALTWERRRRASALVLILLIVLTILIFAVRNSQAVPIDFIFFTRQPRLIWVMLTCAILGGVVGFLAGRPSRRFRFHRRRARAPGQQPPPPPPGPPA